MASPFSGHIDQALITPERPGSYVVTLDGWLVSAGLPAELRVGACGASAPVLEWTPRPDVERQHPECPWARYSGFRAQFRVTAPLAPLETFYFVATYKNGSRLAGAFPPAPVVPAVPAARPSEELSDPAEVQRITAELQEKVCSPERDRLLGDLATRLRVFLAQQTRLALPESDYPEVSVIIPVRDRAECTLACLTALIGQNVPFEIIVVDNASSDHTAELLRRCTGLRVIRNERPLHFLDSANQAAETARGRTLLFLNNDCFAYPGAINRLLQTLDYSPTIGAVGGMLLRPDGTLQEAGCYVYTDGWPPARGRGCSPLDQRFQQVRPVDYCSGAMLLTPRHVFAGQGGFDGRYRPAYYEDVDYCLTLREHGLIVLYEPRAAGLHVEYASAKSLERTVALNLRNRSRLLRKFPHLFPESGREQPVRIPVPARPRILLIDDQLPMRGKGAGVPRTKVLLDTLAALGCDTVFGTTAQPAVSVYEQPDIDRRVSILRLDSPERFAEVLRPQEEPWDLVIVSRPHNMGRFRRALDDAQITGSLPPIVYDAESLFCLRDIRRHEVVDGAVFTQVQRRALIEQELASAAGCSAVLCVSEEERALIAELLPQKPLTLGYAVAPAGASPDFPSRIGFAGLGPLTQPGFPNVDGLLWFANDVYPGLARRLDAGRSRVTWHGDCPARDLFVQYRHWLDLPGAQPDLAGAFGSARVFIAPVRYGAGISLKLIHAAAAGIPAVCTPNLARIMDWRDGVEVLVGDTPERFAEQCARLHEDESLWNEIRQNALSAVKRDFSHERFVDSVIRILEFTLGGFRPAEAPEVVASRLSSGVTL